MWSLVITTMDESMMEQQEKFPDSKYYVANFIREAVQTLQKQGLLAPQESVFVVVVVVVDIDIVGPRIFCFCSCFCPEILEILASGVKSLLLGRNPCFWGCVLASGAKSLLSPQKQGCSPIPQTPPTSCHPSD